MYEKQKKYKSGFTRPEVRINKDDNEDIKEFLYKKGYKSINDYINTIIYADMQYNIVPTKEQVKAQYPTADSSAE